jgi:hypothetical protein
MANSGGFSVVISAVDKLTAPINAINKTLAGIRAPAERLTKSLSKFGDLSGVNALGRGLTGIAGTAIRAATSVTKIATPLAAITSIASVGGVVAMVEAWAKFGQNLQYSAIRAGVGVSGLHALSGAVEMAGGSADAAASGMVALKDVLYDIKGGRNNEAMLFLRDLKIDLGGVTAGTETAATMFPKLARALANVKDATARTRIETVFFGAAAEDIDRLILRGGATLEAYMEIMRRHGVMDEWSAHLADNTRVAWVGLKESVNGLTNSLAERLSPSLKGVLDFFSALIDRNRTKIIDTIGDAVSRLVGWLEKVDWQHVAQWIGEMAERLVAAASAIGSLKNWALKKLGMGPNAVDSAPDEYAVRGPNGMRTENYRPPTPTQNLVGTAAHVLARLMADGESRNSALGLVAGLNVESGFDPKSEVIDTDGKVHRGIAQWSPERNMDFYKWKGKNLKDATLDEQIDFVHYELTHGERGAGDRLANSASPEIAGEVASEYYFRPKNKKTESWSRGKDADMFDQLLPPPANGAVTVTVNIPHAPPGTTGTAVATGAAVATPPNVQHSGVGR